MTALEVMEEILADSDRRRRDRRIRAWYAADRREDGYPYFPIISAALTVASDDLSKRWYQAAGEALGGPTEEGVHENGIGHAAGQNARRTGAGTGGGAGKRQNKGESGDTELAT